MSDDTPLGNLFKRWEYQIITCNHACFRFALKWTDVSSGEPRRRAGTQSYRTEGDKLAETWLFLQSLGQHGLTRWRRNAGQARHPSSD